MTNKLMGERSGMASVKDTKIDQAVTELKRRISQGIYVAGQRLPSEREISQELGISRITVRAALQRLETDNLVSIVPYAGTFVRSPSTKAIIAAPGGPLMSGPELKRSGSFIRAMESQGRQTLVRFIEPSSIIPAGEELGAKMHMRADTEVLRRYRIHLVEGVPYRILDSYYLGRLLGGLLGKDAGYFPLFNWLREHTSLKAARAHEQLRCRMPSAEEATLLNINRSQPVIDMDRWVWADDGTLFEYTHIVANGALHEFAYTYDIDEEANR